MTGALETLVRRFCERVPWPAVVAGGAAYVVGYLATYAFLAVDPRVDDGRLSWEVVVFAFTNAHLVSGVEQHEVFCIGEGPVRCPPTFDVVDVLATLSPGAGQFVLPLVPIALLAAAGYLVTRRADERDVAGDRPWFVGGWIALGYAPFAFHSSRTLLLEADSLTPPATEFARTLVPGPGSFVLVGVTLPVVLGQVGTAFARRSWVRDGSIAGFDDVPLPRIVGLGTVAYLVGWLASVPLLVLERSRPAGLPDVWELAFALLFYPVVATTTYLQSPIDDSSRAFLFVVLPLLFGLAGVLVGYRVSPGGVSTSAATRAGALITAGVLPPVAAGTGLAAATLGVPNARATFWSVVLVGCFLPGVFGGLGAYVGWRRRTYAGDTSLLVSNEHPTERTVTVRVSTPAGRQFFGRTLAVASGSSARAGALTPPRAEPLVVRAELDGGTTATERRPIDRERDSGVITVAVGRDGSPRIRVMR